MSDDDIPLRRPSDDLVELGSQLLRELDGIHREGGSWKEPSLFRAYLQHAQALAWQGIARGDLNAPRHVLDQLLSAQSFVDRHRAEPPDLAARAAEDVHQVIRSLYLADEVLQEARTRVRLADRDRSRTEREILRVLFENRGTYLRRGAVRSRMKTADRVTPARVGQILVDLHDEGIVLRDHGRAQGSPSAAHYALSPQGIEICGELGFDAFPVVNATETQADGLKQAENRGLREASYSPVIEQALSLVADPAVPWEWRSILAGAIGNLLPTQTLMNQYDRWISPAPDEPGIATLKQIITSNWKYQALSSERDPARDVESQEKLKGVLVELERRKAEGAGPITRPYSF
jgi:hypothetical protein